MGKEQFPGCFLQALCLLLLAVFTHTHILCWTTSSSGVEQTFSKVERCHLHRGNGQNDVFRRAVVGLTSADPDSKVVHGDEAVISSARALCSAGRSRQTRNNAAGRKQRLDKDTGKFKVKASAAATPPGGTRRGVPQTEAAWLRRRRAELDAVISTPQPKSQSQNQSNPNAWAKSLNNFELRRMATAVCWTKRSLLSKKSWPKQGATRTIGSESGRRPTGQTCGTWRRKRKTLLSSAALLWAQMFGSRSRLCRSATNSSAGEHIAFAAN